MTDIQPNRTRLPTWSVSERPMARTVGRPMQRFLHVEASGGIVLLVATTITPTLACCSNRDKTRCGRWPTRFDASSRSRPTLESMSPISDAASNTLASPATRCHAPQNQHGKGSPSFDPSMRPWPTN